MGSEVKEVVGNKAIPSIFDLYSTAQKLGGIDRGLPHLKGARTSRLLWESSHLAQKTRLKPAERVMRLLVERELTVRGVPPFLRYKNFSHVTEGSEVAEQLLFDLDWLVTHYPKHKPRLKQLASLWDSNSLLQQGNRVGYHSRRPHWQVASMLGLTDTQRAECRWLSTGEARKRQRAILDGDEAILQKLRRGFIHRAMKKGMSAETGLEFAKWRAMLWRVSTVYEGSPTRVAEVMTAITGESMSRQDAHKQIGKLKRDLRRARSIDDR